MLRLVLALLFLGAGRIALADEFQLVRSVSGNGFGRALVVLDDQLITTAREGARILDGASGESIRPLSVPAGGEGGVALARFLGGERVFVGVPDADQGGAVYVFDPSTGASLGTLRNPDFDPSASGHADAFGSTLLVVGFQVYVGAPWADVNGTVDAGAVYVFDGRTGNLERTLTAPVRRRDDRFGMALVAVGDAVAVGSPFDDRAGTDAGAVFLFNPVSGALLDAFRNVVPGTVIGGIPYAPHFGTALAASGNLLVVGIPYAAAGGAVQVIETTRGTIERRYGGNQCSPAGFGAKLFILSGNLVIGNPFYAQSGRFAVYDGLTVERPVVIRNPSARSGEEFGSAFAAGGATLYVGDPRDVGADGTVGGIYFYRSDRLCGDGQVEAGEGCDDGNRIDGDGCDANCQPTGCGNGRTAGAEQCDDGNHVSGDGCDQNCTYSSCGNGILTSPEECDDGNRVPGDGCDPNCRLSGCGNGTISPGEECDDGNLTSGDGCEPNCRRTPRSGGGNPGGTTTTRPSTSTQPCAVTPTLCDDRDPCTVDSCTAAGCTHAPIPGLDAVICILDGAAARTPGCTGQRVPKAVNKRLVAARKVLVRARDVPRSGGRKKMFRKAAHTLRQAGTIAAFAWRENKVTVGCATEMLQVIGTAKGRFDALRGRRR